MRVLSASSTSTTTMGNSTQSSARGSTTLDSKPGDEDTRLVKGYKAKCSYLAGVYRNIAVPLEAPKIAVFADRMDQRVKDLDQLMVLVQEGVRLTSKAQDEFVQLTEDLAEGKPRRGGLIEAVYDLPSIEAILKISKEANKIQSRLVREDDDYHIDWVLEEYIGSESGVSRKIEKNGDPLRGWFTEGFSGVWTLFGFVKYLVDEKYIQDSVDEIRKERESES
jgi:hypothetical protein